MFLNMAIKHDRKYRIIFVSFSKRNFYLRSTISTFVLNQRCTPVSPFMNFEYNLGGVVDQDLIRVANNTLIQRADEVWVFGEVSDGVLIEIYLAKKFGKKIRFFATNNGWKEFREVGVSGVILEDVSPWMWEYVLAGKKLDRWHPRLRFTKVYPLVYAAYSKRNFYLHQHISKYCLKKRRIPLNPFMLFKYFLGDAVSREAVYLANASIVNLTDEIWTFGDISDGVLEEIIMKKKTGGKVKYFSINQKTTQSFRRISSARAIFEDSGLEKFRGEL